MIQNCIYIANIRLFPLSCKFSADHNFSTFVLSVLISYFCTMKRFLAYSLLAVTLFIGVISSTMHESVNAAPGTTVSKHHSGLPDQHQDSFSAINLFRSPGVGNEQIRLSHSFQHVPFRHLNTFSNLFRISHSIRQGRSQFFIGYTGFLLKSSYKQLDGYYLYYLRKLLI